MKKHKKAIPTDSELRDLRTRLNNGRCSIRKLGQELYGDKGYFRLYKVLRGLCYDPEALSHLRKLAETGNVDGKAHRRGGSRPIKRKNISKTIQCLCPKCGELYDRNAEDLNWTNPLIEVPRVYCDSCLLIIAPPGGNKEDWESFEDMKEKEFQRDTLDGLWSEL